MAPVTTTSTGVARQIIDDPNLIALIERLSKFDSSSASEEVLGDAAAPAPAGSAAVDDAAATDDGDVPMADANTNRYNDSHGDSPAAANKPPPLDVVGLVAELDSVVVPKWQFQEMVRDRHSKMPIVSNLATFLIPPPPPPPILAAFLNW